MCFLVILGLIALTSRFTLIEGNRQRRAALHAYVVEAVGELCDRKGPVGDVCTRLDAETLQGRLNSEVVRFEVQDYFAFSYWILLELENGVEFMLEVEDLTGVPHGWLPWQRDFLFRLRSIEVVSPWIGA